VNHYTCVGKFPTPMSVPYREFCPPDALARWVECCWQIQPAEALRAYPVRPDGCVDLFYSRETGLQIIGTMSATRHFDMAAGAAMGVRLHPGMAGRLIGAAPGELTDQRVGLEDLWGRRARELLDRMVEARAVAEQLRLLVAALPAPPPPDRIQRAIAALTASHGTADLKWIARQANLSARQFRRRCEEESGLPPKHLCRVLRFRHAWRLAETSAGRDWPGVAAEAGYFDQAHLIRDFRQLAGGPPTTVFSNTAAAAIG